jgi:hypothetical protein
MGLSKVFPLSWILSKANGLPSCIKTAPIPWPEASHSITNVFVKSGVARMRVVHIASFFNKKKLILFKKSVAAKVESTKRYKEFKKKGQLSINRDFLFWPCKTAT